MIGFKSVKHQGWFDYKHGKGVNPYPAGSSAASEYIRGQNAAHVGEHWEPPKSKRRYKTQDGRSA